MRQSRPPPIDRSGRREKALIAGMSLPYQRLREFVRLRPGLWGRRRKPKSRFPEPRPEFMPQLGAKKEAEIVKLVNDLNRQVLDELGRSSRPASRQDPQPGG